MVRRTCRRQARRGAIAPLSAILIVALLAMVAFAVDIGYIALARNQAQNSADAAALAGSARLAEQLKRAPLVAGVPLQTAEDLRLAREEAKAFARRNAIAGVELDLDDSDIEIGYLANPYDTNDNTLDTSGWPQRPYNAVRVKVTRNRETTGGAIDLFFAPVIGVREARVSATATSALAMGTVAPKGNEDGFRGGLLPFTYQVDQWQAFLQASGPGSVTANGVTFTVGDDYTVSPLATNSNGVSLEADGILEVKLYPGRTTSGNFGTINYSLEPAGNSTNVLRDLIRNGPSKEDYPDLPEILQASPDGPVDVNGDPGLSAGMEGAVRQIIGQPSVIPLYSSVQGTGNTTFYRIVGFAPISVTGVHLNGSGNSYLVIQPRVLAQKALVTGTERISFGIVPSATPNPLFIGARSLVR